MAARKTARGQTLDQYLAERIDKNTDGHWYWLGAIQTSSRHTTGGYGWAYHWSLDGQQLVHRLVFRLHVGPIPENHEIDHLCMVRHCVNPAHLEAVTRLENMRRQPRIAAQMARTHCPYGHPYSGENVRISTEGKRVCRECGRIRDRARSPRMRKAS